MKPVHYEPPKFKPPKPRARPPIKKISEFKERCFHISENDNEGFSDSVESDNKLDSSSLIHESPTHSPQLRRKPFETSLTRESLHFVKDSPPLQDKYDKNLSTVRNVQFKRKVSKKWKEIAFIIIPLIAMFIIYICVCVSTLYINESDKTKLTLERKKAKESLDEILDKLVKEVQTTFPNQRIDIWNDIASGIYEVVIHPEKPSIIILYGSETATINCLAQLIGQMSGIILGTNDYLTLTPKDFGNDLGEVIYNLKRRIIEKKAVVIQDLLNVNTEAIKAFHNFCDRENPLIDKAIYIITVLVDGYEAWQRGVESLETRLYERLSTEIDKDILDPLVIRITDGTIVPIKDEPVIGKCPLLLQ